MSPSTATSPCIAVSGCGSVTSMYHAPALVQLEQSGLARVAALFDPDDEAVELMRRQFPSARRMADSRDLAGVDLAIVASPPQHHASQAIDALQVGAAVLCEKPMALTLGEAEAIVGAAAEKGSLLAISLVRRFLPATETIRVMLANRVLGEIREIECFEGGPFRWPARTQSFFDRAQGGVFLDVGPHMLDLLVWWLGMPQVLEYEDDSMGGVDANCRFALQYDSGTRVVGRLSRDWELPNRYYFDCTKGWISWKPTEPGYVEVGFHNAPSTLVAELHDTSVSFKRPAAATKGINFEQAFVAQITNVIDALRGNASLIAPGTDGLMSQRLIDECLRVRKLMKSPWFAELEQNRACREAGGGG